MAGVAVVGSPAAVVGSPAALASRRAAIQRKSQREAFAANERERWLRDQMTATDDVARQQQYKAKQATATTAALRRFKKEAAADRSAFDAEVRRKEAAFARVEEDRRHREAERLREAGRAAASFAEYSRRRGGGAAAPAVRLSARDERRLRDAFEAEWSKFERRAEGAALAVDDMPWPDSRISIAGVEPSDSLAASKARVNASLLRWHPDKFESSHAAKFSADALPAVLHRVGLVAERVQLERRLLAATGGSVERTPAPAVMTRPSRREPS